MKETSAKIIADSISPEGYRLTTMELTFPRFILAEVNTHRVFSRSSASSRAVPVRKRAAEVLDNLAWPAEWGRNQRGMQATETLDGWRLKAAMAVWRGLSVSAVIGARCLSALGLHKQLANRPMEPFMWHTAVVSSTRWANFFRQRRHRDAQPEMRELAEKMWDALWDSEPDLLSYGEWHTPFILPRERKPGVILARLKEEQWLGRETADFIEGAEEDLRRQISVARCARVSYLNHDGGYSLTDDMLLYHRLARVRNTDDPPHAGPFEHVATPGKGTGNFRGWNQYRHELFPEVVSPSWMVNCPNIFLKEYDTREGIHFCARCGGDGAITVKEE